MKNLRTLLALATALLLNIPAHATPTLTNVGINGWTGTVDCRLRISGRCDWLPGTPDASFDQVGSAQLSATKATFSVVDSERGTASSSGEMSATSYLPELHAYASSKGDYSPNRGNENPLKWTGVWAAAADTTIWGVQGYRYDGLSAYDLEVTATLESIFSADGQHGNLGHSQMQLSIFNGENYTFTYDDASACVIWSRFCESGDSTSTDRLATDGGILYNTGLLSVTLRHTVMPGDVFYVGAVLDASVCCGETVDSSHTLKLAFNDYSQLSSVALGGVVPEPATTALLLPGLAMLGFMNLRRRRSVKPLDPGLARMPTAS